MTIALDAWKTSSTWWVNIYIAGPIEIGKQICREECWQEALCVNVQPCDYIYTGGEESGYCVGLVNYPRFPRDGADITNRAKALAVRLMEGTYQHSVMVQTPTDTYWLTRREE